MIKLIEKYPITSLVLCVVIMLGFTVDVLPVSIMEARNFISAREMLADNNWILTTMNGEARYEKPPLPTWITSLFGYVFGITSILALRWPALLLLTSIGISIYLLSKQLKLSNAHSLINGFIALTSFYIIGITIEAPWDIYTHGFMLMAILQLYSIFHSKNLTIIKSLLFVIFIACSVLSKGPVSLYVLFLPFVISYGITFKFNRDILFNLKILSLLILGIILGGWWYFHVRIADPETFTRIATKETSNWGSYNVRPFYYYWSFFVQSGLWTIPALMSLLYPYMKSRVLDLKAYRFTFLWTIVAVILLSLIPEKKSRYLMPVLIPLSITIGFYIEFLIRKFKTLKSKKDTIPVYFQFGLIAAIALSFWILGMIYNDIINYSVLIRFVLTSVVFIIIGLLIIKYLKSRNIKIVFYLTIGFMMCLGCLALPLIENNKPDHYKPISELSSKTIELYSLDNIAPEVLYNYGQKIKSLKTEGGFYMPEAHSFLLLATNKNPMEIDALSKFYNIEFINTYDLNLSEKDTRGYRKRLVNKLYKLSRKEN